MSMDDEELDRRLAELPREAQPDDAVWAGIERRMQPARRWPAGLAAGLALAAAGLAAIVQIATRAPEPTAMASAARAEAEMRAMRAGAPARLALDRIGSSEALMAAWAENRAAIEQLERALQRAPDNALLLEFLREARMREAGIVQQGMTTRNRSTNL
jgi:hypothetical protein